MSDATSIPEFPIALWREVERAPRRLLLLDYDGTLAAFRTDRAAATPEPRARAALERLSRAGHTRIAIVSGRPIAELAPLLGDLAIPLVGEHGWEERMPGGPTIRHPLPDDTAAWLASAVGAPALEPWRAQLERKRTSIVLHVRGTSAEDARRALAAAREAWTPPAGAPLALRATDGGLELRATGHDKGSATRALMARMPEAAIVVFLGDDETDEDAFTAVAEHGFGVRVGASPRASHARATLPGIDAVRAFLEEWERHARRASGGAEHS